MKKILFVGDSVTDEGRTKSGLVHFDTIVGKGYVLFINAELGKKFPGQYTVLNRGIDGNRSIDLYARIKSDIINLKPDVLNILIGVNDVWHELLYENGLSAEKYYNIYSLLIEEIREALPDTQIVILESFVLKGRETEEHWEAFQRGVHQIAQKARAIAEKYNLPFITLQDRFDKALELAPAEYWLRDGVHPTAAGHMIIKEAWMEYFLG